MSATAYTFQIVNSLILDRCWVYWQVKYSTLYIYYTFLLYLVPRKP